MTILMYFDHALNILKKRRYNLFGGSLWNIQANSGGGECVFDFIECFTTFLRTHSWLNWIDEDDEVDLKEKPEDTRYIKKITSK